MGTLIERLRYEYSSSCDLSAKPAPTGTKRHQKAFYDIYIVLPALSKTDRAGLGARYRHRAGTRGTDQNIEALTSTYPNIAAQYRP